MAACAEIVGPQRLLGVHDLLRDLIAARDDDDQHARAVERHELDALQDGRMAVGHREAHVPRRARDDVRDAGQQIVHERRGAGMLAQLMLDIRRGAGRPAALEQEVHEDAIPAIGRHASGRGVRLMEIAALFQVGQHASARWPTTPAARFRCASTCDETGSPVSMYSRTSVASRRLDRSDSS